jgi:hypothetical protein
MNADDAFRQETRMGFPPPSNRIRRLINCPPIKEDITLAEKLFGTAGVDDSSERSFGETPIRKKRNIFDRIGDLFKERKQRRRN